MWQFLHYERFYEMFTFTYNRRLKLITFKLKLNYSFN